MKRRTGLGFSTTMYLCVITAQIACDSPAERPTANPGQASEAARQTPATSPQASVTAVRAEELLDLLPQSLAGLRQLDRMLRMHMVGTREVWESKSNYGAAAAERSGTVGIFDYGLAGAADREWIPSSGGSVIWPYDNQISTTEETLGGRAARLLSPDVFDTLRLIVRANDRFDVVFALRPKDPGTGSVGKVDPEELRKAAAAFDWKRLELFRQVPPDYAGRQTVAPPRR
jgi:hypothetical protein